MLSRDEALIKDAFTSISINEKTIVVIHLQKMLTEEGWHIEQVESAKIALMSLENMGVLPPTE